jgi:hypothetical protein
MEGIHILPLHHRSLSIMTKATIQLFTEYGIDEAAEVNEIPFTYEERQQQIRGSRHITKNLLSENPGMPHKEFLVRFLDAYSVSF